MPRSKSAKPRAKTPRGKRPQQSQKQKQNINQKVVVNVSTRARARPMGAPQRPNLIRAVQNPMTLAVQNPNVFPDTLWKNRMESRMEDLQKGQVSVPVQAVPLMNSVPVKAYSQPQSASVRVVESTQMGPSGPRSYRESEERAGVAVLSDPEVPRITPASGANMSASLVHDNPNPSGYMAQQAMSPPDPFRDDMKEEMRSGGRLRKRSPEPGTRFRPKIAPDSPPIIQASPPRASSPAVSSDANPPLRRRPKIAPGPATIQSSSSSGAF
jgi:hypothetical protein